MDTKTQQIIISMYEKRRPLSKISKKTGLSEKKIKNWLNENNLWTGHSFLPIYFNEFYFDKIETEEQAYWLGFIYADGYLARPSTIGIELKSVDANHLHKFKECLCSEHKVKIYKKQSTFGLQENARFALASKHMFKILLSYFGSHRKTFDGHFPILLKKELIPHLIRGFFDGDGSLTWTKKKEGCIYSPQLNFIGTKETLQYIEQISGFNWSWSQRHPEKNTNNYQINVGRVNDVLSFLDYMYKDATVYLDRKYEKYLELLENRTLYAAKARV